MTTATASRCAAHPARRAVDDCPVCGRPRCGADIAGYADAGCPACATARPAAPPPGLAGLAVRAGLAAFAIALVGGWIGTQYVRNKGFSLIAPGLVGVAVAWAATAAAATAPRRVTAVMAAVAVGAAVRRSPSGSMPPAGSARCIQPVGCCRRTPPLSPACSPGRCCSARRRTDPPATTRPSRPRQRCGPCTNVYRSCSPSLVHFGPTMNAASGRAPLAGSSTIIAGALCRWRAPPVKRAKSTARGVTGPPARSRAHSRIACRSPNRLCTAPRPADAPTASARLCALSRPPRQMPHRWCAAVAGVRAGRLSLATKPVALASV